MQPFSFFCSFVFSLILFSFENCRYKIKNCRSFENWNGGRAIRGLIVCMWNMSMVGISVRRFPAAMKILFEACCRTCNELSIYVQFSAHTTHIFSHVIECVLFWSACDQRAETALYHYNIVLHSIPNAPRFFSCSHSCSLSLSLSASLAARLRSFAMKWMKGIENEEKKIENSVSYRHCVSFASKEKKIMLQQANDQQLPVCMCVCLVAASILPCAINTQSKVECQ